MNIGGTYMKSKYILILIVVCSFCLNLVGCGTSQVEKKPDEKPAAESKQDTNANIVEQVIVDKNNIKITAKSIDYDGFMGPQIKLLIENNSSQNITVQARNFSINGIMISPIMSADVNAGKKTNTDITISTNSLKEAKITTIKNIEFGLNIFDSTSWDDIFDVKNIKLETSNNDYVQIYNKDGNLVVDQNDIKIYVLNLDDSDDIWGANINVYVENNSTQDITVQVRDVSVNGFMASPTCSIDVDAQKKAYDSITFLNSTLEENDIKDITNVELKFKVFNASTWRDIFNTKNIELQF